jgi:hypothetical protein
MEILGGFRLRGTKGTYHVSNRLDQPFAGNCGNKWLALGSENPMKRVGDEKDPRGSTDERLRGALLRPGDWLVNADRCQGSRVAPQTLMLSSRSDGEGG